MSEAGKLRRRERLATRKDLVVRTNALPETRKVRTVRAELLPRGDDEAIGGLLGAPPQPSEKLRRWLSPRRILFSILILALATPIVIWIYYRSQYVMSKNAAVRGQLTEIGTRLAGQVTKVEVDVGDRVVANQILVRMEDRHLQAEVQEAAADVAGLERTVEVERLNIRHERRKIGQQGEEAAARLAAADAQAEAARIRSTEARRNHEMRESLFARDGVVSREDVRLAATEDLTAAAKLDEATANSAAARSVGMTVDLAGDAITIQERKLGVLEADLLRARARLTRAQAELEGTLIRAPENGAILRRIVQPGGSVKAGDPVIAMRLGDDVWIEAWVDEDDIGSVAMGGLATVTLHSLGGRELTGVVDQIGLTTDLEIPDANIPKPRASRMRLAPVVGVRIRLQEPPLELVPGLSAVVAIRKAG